MLGKKYRPLDDFDVFILDDVPSNSDVTFIVAQYAEALEKFRADNIQRLKNSIYWRYVLEDSDEIIQTARPAKLQK